MAAFAAWWLTLNGGWPLGPFDDWRFNVDEYAAAWADGETQESERKAEISPLLPDHPRRQSSAR